MKRGVKPKPDYLKVISGTDQKCRMTGTRDQALEVLNEKTNTDQIDLKRPSCLKGESRKAWDRIIPILHNLGKADTAHLDLILRYCLIAGKQVDLAKKGEYLVAAEAAEQRRVSETLGLIVVGRVIETTKPKSNKFGNNGNPNK